MSSPRFAPKPSPVLLLSSHENSGTYVEQITLWTACCDRDGTKPGCTKGYHVAVRKNHFKRFQMYPPHEEDSGLSRVFEGRILKANEFVNESLSPNRSGKSGDEPSDVADRDSLDTDDEPELDVGGEADAGLA